MKSIVTVTTGATETKLTTLARVKSELAITSDATDALLQAKIDEASSTIQAWLGFVVARETVSQTFWPERYDQPPEALLLDRTPVANIATVTVDDVEVDSTEYRLDAKPGLLYRLDACGYPAAWCFCKSAVVAYTGGHLLPGEDGRTLDPAIERAAVSLVSGFWLARGRDPLLKRSQVDGMGEREYWVGGVGQADDLPPDVISMLTPFRRIVVA